MAKPRGHGARWSETGTQGQVVHVQGLPGAPSGGAGSRGWEGVGGGQEEGWIMGVKHWWQEE